VNDANTASYIESVAAKLDYLAGVKLMHARLFAGR
jgi:hypothetical protein